MNPTMHPVKTTPQHVHLDIELDPQNRFHYHSQDREGHRLVLHRGDTLTLSHPDRFSIHFANRSPFDALNLESHPETLLRSGESFITACVRNNADYVKYQYTVKVSRRDRTFEDTPQGVSILEDDPEILIESTN